MSNTAHLPKPATNGNVGVADDPVQRVRMELLAAELNEWSSYLSFIGPTAIKFNVKNVQIQRGAGHDVVTRLTAITPLGPHVFHLPPHLADDLAGLLSRYARQAAAGIHAVPATKLVVP